MRELFTVTRQMLTASWARLIALVQDLPHQVHVYSSDNHMPRICYEQADSATYQPSIYSKTVLDMHCSY